MPLRYLWWKYSVNRFLKLSASRLFKNYKKELTNEAGNAMSPRLTIYGYGQCLYPFDEEAEIALDDCFDNLAVDCGQVNTQEGSEDEEDGE